MIAITLKFRTEAAKEAFLEFQDLPDVHAPNERLGSGHVAFHQEHVIELVFTRRNDAGTFVDFARIEQVEH